MKTLLKFGKACLIGLVIVIISLSAFEVLAGLQNVVSPVLSKAQATHVALNYLADKNGLLDPSTANAPKAFFYRESWYVMVLVDPSSRPGAILVKVNPVTGTAKRIPLK